MEIEVLKVVRGLLPVSRRRETERTGLCDEMVEAPRKLGRDDADP